MKMEGQEEKEKSDFCRVNKFLKMELIRMSIVMFRVDCIHLQKKLNFHLKMEIVTTCSKLHPLNTFKLMMKNFIKNHMMVHTLLKFF